ncbi:TPA: hypothetical protein HA241_04550 [Candidatus Woesearchaeota archaeon]|nr:hypothetical protein [Candidatus Woesearchaeota archaeon]
MDVLFLDAPFAGTVELCPETIDYLKRKQYHTVGLYASVQFCNALDRVRTQLKELEIVIVTSQPDRTHASSQLLGCDNDLNSLRLGEEERRAIDCYLYIGDGRFHPLALVYGQKDLSSEEVREVVMNDPVHHSLTILAVYDIVSLLKKYRGALLKFIAADRVGVLVTIKPGQEQFKPGLLLEQKYPLKKFYYFIDNVISFDQLENFPFVNVWVNTACPRVGFDDQEKFVKGVINLYDALNAEKVLEQKSVLNELK